MILDTIGFIGIFVAGIALLLGAIYDEGLLLIGGYGTASYSMLILFYSRWVVRK